MTAERFSENDIIRAAEISRNSFSDPWSEDGFLSYVRGENSVCFAAYENGYLIGYIMASSDGDSAWIDSIASDTAHRRRGVGTLLIDTLRNETHGLPITLEVRESNLSARKFYEKYGFENAGVRRNMYSSPRENAVVMILKGS